MVFSNIFINFENNLNLQWCCMLQMICNTETMWSNDYISEAKATVMTEWYYLLYSGPWIHLSMLVNILVKLGWIYRASLGWIVTFRTWSMLGIAGRDLVYMQDISLWICVYVFCNICNNHHCNIPVCEICVWRSRLLWQQFTRTDVHVVWESERNNTVVQEVSTQTKRWREGHLKNRIYI